VGVLILQRCTDDDHHDTEGADGAGAHEHWPSSGFVDEADAEKCADHHDWALQGVHQELLLGGRYAGRLRHQRHVVGCRREVDLAEKAHAEYEEHTVASAGAVEELAIVVPALQQMVSRSRRRRMPMDLPCHCQKF